MRTNRLLTSLSALLVLGLVAVPSAAAGKSPRVKNGIVQACLATKGKKAQRGTIRVVNSPRQCKKKKGEQALTWALVGTASGGTGTEGATGPQGPTGPQGATGAPGTAGPAGEPGGQGEKGSAATIEDTLKETIATQSKEIEVLLGKVGTLGDELLDLEDGLGTVKTSVTNLGTSVNKSLDDVKTELNGTIDGVETNLEGQIGTLKTNVVDPLVSKVGLLDALEPLTGKVDALEELPGRVDSLAASLTKLEPLTDNVKVLNELPGKVTDLSGTVTELAPLTDKVTQLAALPGEVGLLQGATEGLKSTTQTLGLKVASQCTSLGEVVTQANGLGGALGELLDSLRAIPLLGSLVGPTLPGNTTSVTC